MRLLIYILMIKKMKKEFDKKELAEWMRLNWYETNKTNDVWLYQLYLNYSCEHLWLWDNLFFEVVDAWDIEYVITLCSLEVENFWSIQIVLDWDTPMFEPINKVVDYLKEIYDRMLLNIKVLSPEVEIKCPEIYPEE